MRLLQSAAMDIYRDDPLSDGTYTSPGFTKRWFYDQRDGPRIELLGGLVEKYKCEMFAVPMFGGYSVYVYAQSKQELDMVVREVLDDRDITSASAWALHKLSAYAGDFRNGTVEFFILFTNFFSLTYCSPMFQALLPFRDVIAQLDNGTCFVTMPERNFVTVAYGAMGKTAHGHSSYYCVIKDTGLDLWVTRLRERFNVLNAGVLLRRVDEFTDHFSAHGCPPEWCDYLTIEELTDDYVLQGLRFNTDAQKRAPGLFGALMSRMDLDVRDSTIEFTVRAHAKNVRRMMTKISRVSSKCVGCGSAGDLNVSCPARRCPHAVCRRCLQAKYGKPCICGTVRNFLWWYTLGLFKYTWARLEIYGNDSPPSLKVTAAGALRRYCAVGTLTVRDLPMELLRFTIDNGEMIRYLYDY